MYKLELCLSVNNIALPLLILSSFLLSLSLSFGNKDKKSDKEREKGLMHY